MPLKLGWPCVATTFCTWPCFRKKIYFMFQCLLHYIFVHSESNMTGSDYVQRRVYDRSILPITTTVHLVRVVTMVTESLSELHPVPCLICGRKRYRKAISLHVFTNAIENIIRHGAVFGTYVHPNLVQYFHPLWVHLVRLKYGTKWTFSHVRRS